jgi:uncharacterized protein (DUF1330 family)
MAGSLTFCAKSLRAKLEADAGRRSAFNQPTTTKREATMKTRHVIGLSMLAGGALGAIAVQGLHAQARPPVYVVTDISEITNTAGREVTTGRSGATVQALIGKYGGRYLARTEKITALYGVPPKRSIIYTFASVEKAQAFYNSPEQKKVNEVRMKTTKSRVYIVEGM